MEKLECDKQPEQIDRLIRTLNADEITDWLIEYKGVNPEFRENVISNLKDQINYWRLRGRLDVNLAQSAIKNITIKLFSYTLITLELK